MTRRGLLVGAVAAGLGGVAVVGGGGRAVAAGEEAGGAGAPRFRAPAYALGVDGESVVSGRVDRAVAPGVVLTSFDLYGRTGWLRAHVLNADLGDAAVSVDLVAGEVSAARALKGAADGQGAVAAVNGDYFDITETYAAEGPEIKGGQLRKGTGESSTVMAVGADRVARLADLAVDGSVTVGGTRLPLAALNSPSVPADGVAAYTPLWGPGDRTLIQDPGPYREVVVDQGKVTAVGDAITAAAVPAGGFVLLGRGAAAGQLGGVRVGDTATVDFAPRTDVPLRMALGSGAVLVRGGTAVDFPPSTGNDAPKPRTAVGWPQGGHRLLLVAVDGAANFSAGLSFDDMAALMARLGAYEAFMLDGGGSTEIVARRPGDSGVSVVNTPSDGGERPVPDGVGLFAQPGSGRLRGLDVRPGADRVVPGLTLDVAVAGYDETWAPAATAGHRVDWTAEPGSLGSVDTHGVFRAGRPGAGVLRARAESAGGEHELRVLGELDRLAFAQRALTIEPGATAEVALTGYDADGFGAPVAARDARLDYDKAVLTVEATAAGLTLTGAKDAGGKATTLTATVQGVTAELPVTVGLVDVSLAEFEPAESVTWTALAARGTAAVGTVTADDRPGAPAGNHALRLTYDFTGQPSTSAAYAVAGPGPLTLPPGTRKLALWVNGDGKGHWLRAMLSSQGTTNVPFTFAQTVDWTGWRQVVGELPAGFSDPITLARVYLAETLQTNKNAGQLDLDGLTAQVGTQPDAAQPPRPDPYVVEQGELPASRWTFAVLSDLHVSAAAGLDSFSGRQAVAALGQVAAAKPDFVLVNGDFVDNNTQADFDLATGLLRDHLPAGLPVYWTPGNHEAGLSATGGLDTFLSATGRPNKQVLDHKGVRFILLDSHTGDMRTADWSQVPLLQSELAKAEQDRSVTGVVVSFHHPLVDPSGAGASQLSDQLAAELLQRWLAGFRERSGKPVALFTGHAHTASVSRADGVLDVTTPAVGKTPYSSPDQGGFFGWMHVAVDPRPARIRPGQPSPATREWLVAETRPLIDGIELDAPATLAVGQVADLHATGMTSEFGLRFPLRFPASVVWSGGDGVAVATSAAQAAAARRGSGTLAVLDLTAPGAPTLTAVGSGEVTVTVAAGGLTAQGRVTLG